MQSKKGNRAKDVFLGLVLGLSLFLPLLYNQGFFSKVPYARVDRLHLSLDTNLDIQYKATFYKYGCEFYRMGVFGLNLGEWEKVYSIDPTGEKGDRQPGWQTIELLIQGKPEYSEYEIRTEHICTEGGKDTRVAKTFDKFKYKDLQ